jgi:hypothetical protein
MPRPRATMAGAQQGARARTMPEWLADRPTSETPIRRTPSPMRGRARAPRKPVHERAPGLRAGAAARPARDGTGGLVREDSGAMSRAVARRRRLVRPRGFRLSRQGDAGHPSVGHRRSRVTPLRPSASSCAGAGRAGGREPAAGKAAPGGLSGHDERRPALGRPGIAAGVSTEVVLSPGFCHTGGAKHLFRPSVSLRLQLRL